MILRISLTKIHCLMVLILQDEEMVTILAL